MENRNLAVNPLEPFLTTQKVIVIDGALATELEGRGADLRDPLWSAKILIERPELIERVHYDYFAAGADVAITASYQASFPGFAQRGIGWEEAANLMRRSVELADQARNRFWNSQRSQASTREKAQRVRPLVAASVGPYGAWLADGSEYHGNYGITQAELADFHRPRLHVLAEAVRSGAADLLACETIPSQAEAEVLFGLLSELGDIPAWISFSCCDEQHVCHGERFVDCVRAASAVSQIVAAGINCTAPHYVETLLQSAKETTNKFLLAYPNSGEVWQADSRSWAAGTEGCNFMQWAEAWANAGAQLIGGCCRTTPKDIELIRQAIA